MTLNLKSEKGLSILYKLASEADVLIQNFRPGVVERLGIGEGDIRKKSPNIIYVSISGWGERGPLSSKPVYDPIIQALSGLTTIQAGSDSARPKLIRTILPDKLTGVVAAQAISTALFARERTGKGEHIRLSMLDAVLGFLWASDMNAQTYVNPPGINQRAASFIDLIYETKDGYMTVSTMGDKEWLALTRAFNRPSLLTDRRFKTPQLREKNANQRLALIQEELKTKTTKEWLAIFEKEEVPSAPALTRQEMVNHPQVRASEILIQYEHPAAGTLRQTRTPARFNKHPIKPPKGAPRLGENNAQILTELGFTTDEITELIKAGAIGDEVYPTK